jgi:hypothetical protein
LTSWLVDGGREVISVENSETKEVQSIATEPNQNNLRLVEMHPNLNPRSVEAVISDGKQQGTVKFRYDGQSPSEPTASTLAQVPAAADSQKSSTRFANLPNAQNSGLQENVSHNRAPGSRLYPGLPRVHWEGGLKPPSEEPRSWPKHNLPYSATAKSNSR